MSSEQKQCAKDCDVCCSPNYFFIKCCYCDADACQKCYETYILDQFEDKCMYCSKTWNFEFMQVHFRAAYLEKAYKDKKKQLLFEKEKAMMPQTQTELQEIKRKQERDFVIKKASKRLHNTLDKISELNKELKKKSKEAIITAYAARVVGAESDERAADAAKKKEREIREEIEDLIYVADVRRKELQSLYNEDKEEKKEEKEEKKLPTYPCSVNDCRGFLTYDNKKKRMVCGMCEIVHCKDCRCEEKAQHKCDPNTLETIKLMDKDTKPCPSCAIPIYKIEGCDQMWCTKCHTAFSWKSGKIETGHIHNPHYWQWLQTSGKDMDAVRRMANGDNNAAGMYRRFDVIAPYVNQPIADMLGLFTHIRHVELPRFVPDNDNKDLRMKYLKKETTDKNFLMTLYRREKKYKFDVEMTQILTMYLDTTQELILDTFNSCRVRKDFVRYFYAMCIGRLKELTEYARKEMEKLYKRYDYTMSVQIQAAFDSLYRIMMKPPTQSVKKQNPDMTRLMQVAIGDDIDEATRAEIERAMWE